ncbi:hypothetical protein KODAMA_00200 [Serratia phage vB_SmaM-Kodama]|nr:hypothetical protein KODAMA_00200 [Serratia phage vB_SmaM-Kodama]
MKYTREILKNKTQGVNNPSQPTMESFSQFLDNHITLEAASSVANESNALMAGILIDSMGLGESISLESENVNYDVSLEAAKEQNHANMQKKASEFNSGFMGWLSKKFSARGKLFSELDELIEYLEGKEGEISIDGNAFKIDFGGGNVKQLMEDFAKAYKTLAELHMTRCSKSVEMLKGGSNLADAYKGILAPFVSGMSRVVSVKTGQRMGEREVLGEKALFVYANKGRVGTTNFMGIYIPVDINDIRNRAGEGLSNIRDVAHFYTKISENTYVTFDDFMSPAPFESPKTFQELLEIVKAYRAVMDDVMDNGRSKALQRLVDEENKIIKSQRKPEAEKFASWQMSASNFSTAKLFFESCETAMVKKFKSLKLMAKAASK